MNRTEKLIYEHEGYREKVYHDTEGHPTIGIGLNLDAGLPKDEAVLLMKHRIKKISSTLPYKIPTFNSLSAPRQDVLISMAYNMGISKLMKFKKMLVAINEGNFARARHELLDSVAARKLKARYGTLADMMVRG